MATNSNNSSNLNNSAAKTQKASSSKPKATSQTKTASTQKTTSQAKSTTPAKSNTCSKTTTTTTTQKSNNSTTQTATVSNKKTKTTTTTTCSAKNASNLSLNSNSRNTNYSNVNNSRSSQNQTSKGVPQAKTIDNRTNVNDSRGLQNQTSKGIPQSRISRLNNNVTSLNNNKNKVVNNKDTSRTSIYQNQKSNINYSLPKKSGGYYTSPNYSVNKPTYVRNTPTTYKGNTNINYCLPKRGGGYYTSPNYSTIRPTYARNNSCIASIKTGAGRTNANSSIYVPKTNSNISLSFDPVESLNMIENMNIKFNDIDLSKISPSAYDATNGKFVNVNSDIWKNAQLNITQRDDGTYLIKNGDIPLGFTVGDGFKLLNSASSSSSSTPTAKNQIYTSNVNNPYSIGLGDLDLSRLSKTEEGAFKGNFTNMNLASYKNSNLTYDVKDNGIVSIKNGNNIIGYTDIFGLSQDKNTKYGNNSSPLMDYLVNTNANHSLTSVEDLTSDYMRQNIRSLDPKANIYGTQESLERFQELFPSITSTSNPYVSRAVADSQMERIEVPIWDGEKESTMNLTVHNKLVENYKGAFSELADMKYTVNPSTTAAYVYRNTQGTSGSGGRLSDHSFGGAFDLNWDVNPIQYGKNTNSSDRVITEDVAAVMNKYGFTWGGDWSGEKDYMHFSYTGG